MSQTWEGPPTEKTTRRLLLTLILVSGLIGSIAAFVSTPRLVRVNNVVVACETITSDQRNNCVADTTGAAVRGAGVLLLTVVAFAGVTVILKD